jgi:hypothetical protein
MTITETLKSLNATRLQTEELVELSAGARALKAEFDHYTADVPDWLTHAIRILNGEIAMRFKDELERKLVEAKVRIERFQSRDEKLAKAREEYERLSAVAAGSVPGKV